MKFTDKRLLEFKDPRCPTDRSVRHAEYREQAEREKGQVVRRQSFVERLNAWVYAANMDAVDAEIERN